MKCVIIFECYGKLRHKCKSPMIWISSVTYTCALISRLDDYKGGFIMCICVLLDLYDMEIFT